MFPATSFEKWLLAVGCGVLVLAAATPLAAVEFSYGDGGDGANEVVYKFTPETGTLDDLEVVYRSAGGEFRFRPAAGGGITQFTLAGEIVETADRRHEVALLRESQSRGWYKAKFRWSFEGESFNFVVRIRLEGKTLVMKFSSGSDSVILFDPARSEGTPDVKIVDIPYGHNVLFSNGLFIATLLDPLASDASQIFPTKHYLSSDSAVYAPWAFYRTLSDGSRNALRETVTVTVSSEIEDTFYQPNNPVSPYRKLLSKYLVADLWRRSFTDYLEDIGRLVSLGFEDIFTVLHVWQRFGFDNGLPTTTPPSPRMGGKRGLREVSRLCRENGYLFSLHTNYVDFYPNSKSWQPRHLALGPDGEPIEAWFNPSTQGQSFLMKPSKAQRYARRVEPSIHEKYGTTAGYLDVHTAILPSMKVDFDAGVKGAGRQLATFEHYKKLISYVRKEHGGPVAGEGKGSSARIWAGHIDAIEADPRSLWQEIEGVKATEVPTIVDYKLRNLHSLFVAHGAGYFVRFFKRNGSYSHQQFSRYMATELAFGNAAFFGRAYFDQEDSSELKRKYAFMRLLQGHYLAGEAEEILYLVNGRYVRLSQALKELLPGLAKRRVEDVLAERLGMLKVEYSPGFTLYVNRSKKRTVQVVENGVGYELRAGDFLALNCGAPIAYSAKVDGLRREFVCEDCAAGTPGGTCG
ncbi:MAG: hypothetical protein IH936_04705 [Acidobacteria bacterium]|nr:hypothetical protein [Acidobacteriota bacterium]